MSLISTWSTDPNDNQMPTPNGWPEGQAPSTVNNCARQMMSSIREQWNSAAWFNWGYNVSRVSGSSFLVTSATNSTVTLPAAFEVNARIKLFDSTTLYGTITTVSSSAASTLVTFTSDAHSLTASFSSVANSIIPATNTPIPGLSIPTDVVTQTTQQIYGVDNGATNSAHINLSPVLQNYVSGQLVVVKALQTNTGATTLQVGALGNRDIKKNVSLDLAAGDIQTGQIVPLVYDGTNFQMIAGSGGTANLVTDNITQNSHGFVIGNILYLNGGTYTKAIASSSAASQVVGIVSGVNGTNNFTITLLGPVSGLTGLSSGNVYYLSPTVAGSMTLTEPSTAGQISKPIFVADSTTSGYFINWRGTPIAASTGAGRLIGMQVFKGSGTFTPDPATAKVLVKAWGGGGGGGTTNTGTIGGAGGGAGAYVEGFFAVAGITPATITIGAGGAGGLANNGSNGSDGTATSFGSALVAAPGKGGLSSGGGPGDGGSIALSTTPTGGIAIAGGRGADAMVGVSIPATGGHSFGSYGLPYPTDITVNTSYPNSGMGGGGGNNSLAAEAGGSGLMIIYEFS